MSGYGNCFFEIPIYRCDQIQHTRETEEELRNHIASRFKFAPKLPEKVYQEIRKNAENDFNANLWYPWRFNEVVGWIRLYAEGTRILGELWHIKAKKISRRLVRKEFIYVSMKFIELSVDSNDSSLEIFNKISTELEQRSSKSYLKKRYVDIEIFTTIGPFIDWRQLLGLNND